MTVLSTPMPNRGNGGRKVMKMTASKKAIPFAAKVLSMFLAIICVFSITAVMAEAETPVGIEVSAASSTAAFDILTSSKYAKVYTLATTGKTIPYTSSGLSTRGTVSYGASRNSYIDNRTDEIYILDVGKNSKGVYWALVSYPSGNKRVNAYIELSAVTSNNGSHVKATSSGKFNCAPRRDAAISGSYYVAKGDTVYLVATYGSRYQIMYNSGSVWRIAWCNSSDYNKFCVSAPQNTNNEMVDVTRSFDGKKITLMSVQNGKYLCADSGLSNTPAVCNRSSASTSASSYEVFTVKVTSDGWAGLRAHNGKWLSAVISSINSPVRATAPDLLSWECFRIYKKGNDYYLKAQANNKWLCVRVDMNNAPVQAYASAASTWERFSISVVSTTSTTTADTTKKQVQITASSLNVRAGAGTGYAVVTKVSKGGIYTYTDTRNVNGTTWYKISVGNTTGWVSGAYAKVVSGTTPSSVVSSGIKYAPYTGVNYTSILNNARSSGRISAKEYNNRIAILEEAKKMVTVIWTAPVSFHTWKSSGGVYNSNKDMQYNNSTSTTNQFVKGYTYVGIPYAANVGKNNYNAEGWIALINERGISTSTLEGSVTFRGITRSKTTYRGIDCSGLVHKAYSVSSCYNVADKDRLSCAGMMKSSSWKKINASDAIPGDVLICSTHIMIYLGKTSEGKIAVFESIADGKHGASGCRYYELDSVSGYGYYRYTGIAK